MDKEMNKKFGEEYTQPLNTNELQKYQHYCREYYRNHVKTPFSTKRKDDLTQNSYYYYNNLPNMHPLTKESIFGFETSFNLKYGYWNSSPQ
ncbi:hypothetical protein CANARDRAFT_9964 [[Candida] arabinofermentans NRRL YB-2248]|uniref:Uncharacterized protein n=1 Tax=[Candida] arabinofermentans NRRL YB-2248 TaxID=983967 RepID=A0A1E4SU88_9ASCO|nr:hypothetical protein CANARDRAFT_9964 [[Candida] arabinofermentans NRRL YB-2248]